MGAKKPKSIDVRIPDDPDPTPVLRADSSAEVVQANRQERKRTAASYGRSKTILAGNNNENQKNILGG